MNICKACRDKRCHTELEKRKFHPLMGHGFAAGQGWSHPEAERLHDQEQAALKAKAANVPLPPAQIPGTVSNVGGPQ
jgi:hypothetical protein